MQPVFTAEATLRAVNYLVAMLISLTFHEAAHALVAFMFGDRTAKDEGRLTLNPAAHIDPLGTLLLPAIGAFTGLPIIGWAKPVPVDLRNLRWRRFGNLAVSLAGPLSNLLLAFLCLVALSVHHITKIPADGTLFHPFVQLAEAMVWVNAFLAFFNLLPLPPLDGAALATTLMPRRWADKYEAYIAPYGYFLLMMIVISGGLHWLPGVASGYVRICVALIQAALPSS